MPQGSLCNLNLRFKAGLPPDAVYNIIIDPENKRVFKNIKVCTDVLLLLIQNDLAQMALSLFRELLNTSTLFLIVLQCRCLESFLSIGLEFP